MDRACPKGPYKIDGADFSRIGDRILVTGCAVLSYAGVRVHAIWGRGVEFVDTAGYMVEMRDLTEDKWTIDVIDEVRFRTARAEFCPSAVMFENCAATQRSTAFAQLADRTGHVAVCDARHRNSWALVQAGFSPDEIVIFECNPLVVAYLRILALVLFYRRDGFATPAVVMGRLEEALPQWTGPPIKSLYFDVCGGLPHAAPELASALTVYAATCSYRGRSPLLDFEIRRPAGFTVSAQFQHRSVRCDMFVRA